MAKEILRPQPIRLQPGDAPANPTIQAIGALQQGHAHCCCCDCSDSDSGDSSESTSSSSCCDCCCECSNSDIGDFSESTGPSNCCDCCSDSDGCASSGPLAALGAMTHNAIMDAWFNGIEAAPEITPLNADVIGMIPDAFLELLNCG